jgi:hypothetical protein
MLFMRAHRHLDNRYTQDDLGPRSIAAAMSAGLSPILMEKGGRAFVSLPASRCWPLPLSGTIKPPLPEAVSDPYGEPAVGASVHLTNPQQRKR